MARDLAKLSVALINNHPEHYKIYKEKSFTYNGIKQYNRNGLLRTDSTVDGLKTGYTSEAGYGLVASAKRDDMRLVSVVLGSASATDSNFGKCEPTPITDSVSFSKIYDRSPRR